MPWRGKDSEPWPWAAVGAMSANSNGGSPLIYITLNSALPGAFGTAHMVLGWASSGPKLLRTCMPDRGTRLLHSQQVRTSHALSQYQISGRSDATAKDPWVSSLLEDYFAYRRTYGDIATELASKATGTTLLQLRKNATMSDASANLPPEPESAPNPGHNDIP